MDTPPGFQMTASARLEVLNTGTELLFGSVVNSHVVYFGQRLFPLGLRIQRQSTVPDGDAIREAILEAAPRCDIILITGGLGPTTDDITREIVAELTGRSLHFDESIFAEIRERFEKRGFVPTARVKLQAYVPDGATVLPNDFGTAPGLYLPALNGLPHLLLFPGPPRELMPMFDRFALPILKELAGTHDLAARVFRTTGLGESMIEDRVGEKLLALKGLELGYCARMGEVDIRIVGNHETVEAATAIIENALGPQLVTTEEQELEEVVVQHLAAKGATLAVAESCTGGLLANRITNVPGSSAVFLEGNVTYSNGAKTRLLGVPSEMIEEFGAVSEQVAKAMAEGTVRVAGTDFGLSTTGIAGPDGGSSDKPVGTVYVGLASRHANTQVDKLFFPTDRQSFKRIVTQHALDMLRKATNGLASRPSSKDG